MQRQFYRAFEFGSEYLMTLLDASVSGEFGTFLFDSEKQRVDAGVFDLCESIWTHLQNRSDLRNPHYQANDVVAVIPSSNMALLELWSSVYLRLDVSAMHDKDKAFAKAQDTLRNHLHEQQI